MLQLGEHFNKPNTLTNQMKFEWSEDMEIEFRELKEEVTASKFQGYQGFDSTEPFILTIDWSALNIAGILSQKKKEWDVCWGQEAQPIQETLSIYERRTVIFSKEHGEMETYPEVLFILTRPA